jgi:PiT family inorganic phosphate transporter
MTLLIVVIVLALIFDYINGFHDAANSIATIVSTKVLSPFQAVIWAAFFNFVAFFIFKDHSVANTIGKTVTEEFITLPVILSGLIAAIFWNLLTWWYGIPSSSSHTLIGGFAGAAICHAFVTKGYLPIDQIVDSSKVLKTLSFIFLAPLIGMLISMIITIVTINPNTWLRILIMTAAGVIIFFMFNVFERNKINENVANKIFKVDSYKKQLIKDSTVQIKLDSAISRSKQAEKYIALYDEIGADSVANLIYHNVAIKDAEVSKLNDNFKKFLKLDSLKYVSKRDTSIASIYQAMNDQIKESKHIMKSYHTKGLDTVVDKLALIPAFSIDKKVKLKKALTIDFKKDIRKEIDKADNSMIIWGILIVMFIFALFHLYNDKIREPNAHSTGNMYKKLQLLSSAAFSIGHGGNDAQKVMGIIAAALVANGNIADLKNMPNWVPFACYAAIGLGTLSGGWKIVKTMGTKITKVTPLEGVCSETAGALTLFMTEQMGIPVSTTHTITGAIIGVGATKRLSAVRWGVTINLLWAWILTIPISACVAALTYWVVSFWLH